LILSFLYSCYNIAEVIKMKKLTIFLFLLVIGLIGCQNEPQLSQPDQIFFEDYLYWEEVEHADEYVIIINDEEHIRQEPLFDGLVEEGVYDIQIIARGQGYLDSEPLDYPLEIDYPQEAQLTISQDGQQVSWNSVNQASHYLVSYNQSFERVDGTTFDMSTISETVTMFSVQAVFPDGSTTEAFILPLN